MTPKVTVSDDLVDYERAVAYMRERVEAIRNGAREEIWLLEHPPLFTLGTSANVGDILNPIFPVYPSQRGGKVTYHGPGQVVGYVMIDLTKRDNDLRAHVSRLEEWVIRTLARLGLKAVRKPGRIGAWIDDENGERKIAAAGVRVTRGIAWHGVSLNVCPNLDHYEAIVPCGLKDYGVTDLKAEGVAVETSFVKKIMAENMAEIFAL